MPTSIGTLPDRFNSNEVVTQYGKNKADCKKNLGAEGTKKAINCCKDSKENSSNTAWSKKTS